MKIRLFSGQERTAMTLRQVIKSAEKLSDQEKLALIENVVQMLQRSSSANQNYVNSVAKQHMKDSDTGTVADLDTFLDESTEEEIITLLREHLDSPDPDPAQTLHFGMFKDRLPVDEAYFRMAEWRPSNEDLDGA
jgi:hypothetical protein